MSMLKVRLKALKSNSFAIFPGSKKKTTRRKSTRIDRAVNGKHTLRTISPEVREMMIERECLKIELKNMALCQMDNAHPSVAIQMADKIRRIENLNKTLKGKK